MIEVIYPNDDDPRKEKESQPDPFMLVDAYLEAKTRLGDEIPTISELAQERDIEMSELRGWLEKDEFKEALGAVTKFLDEGLEDPNPWSNRVDVNVMDRFLQVFKERYGKDE